MGNILIDNNGNALLSNNKALEITSAIDLNITPENIKKDVNILGVTGTYEGNPATTFYTCSSILSTRAIVDPSTNTLYVSYPSVNDKIPDMFIVYDINKAITKNISYAILSTTQPLSEVYYTGIPGKTMYIKSLTPTMATLECNSSLTQFQFAPIYLS